MKKHPNHNFLKGVKIGVLGTRGFPDIQGGVETHCEHLYTRLVKHGCEISVLARKPYTKKTAYNYKGVNIISLSCPRSRALEALFHTLYGVFVAKKSACSIVHFHAVGPSLLVPLARLLRLKVIMTNHGPDYNRKKWGKFAKFMLKLGERLGSKRAHAVISISPSIANNTLKAYNRKSTVIPNGVIMPQILESTNFLERCGIESRKYILTVGRFVPEKGFHDLIVAYNSLPSGSWKLVVVGKADHPDKYSLELEKKARQNPNIILTGFLKGKPLLELYSHAGLFVLPSYHEGLPIVLLEAMSYGLPCIASNIPANRDVELLSQSRFFSPGNIERLTEMMLKYMSEPFPASERAQLLQGVAEKYDWDKISSQTLQVYKQVMSV